jgi:hypothetical protein
MRKLPAELKAAILERPTKKARKVCVSVRMTHRMTKTAPITCKGKWRGGTQTGGWGREAKKPG